MKKNTTILILAIFAACSFVNTDLFAQKNKQQKEKIVEIITEMGTIKVKLYNETPLHRDNFLKLAENGEMNGSTFHRVIRGFMIQGGGKPGTNGRESIGETIPAEILPQYGHTKGVLAAARMGDISRSIGNVCFSSNTSSMFRCGSIWGFFIYNFSINCAYLYCYLGY